jgi:hypothetical protein
MKLLKIITLCLLLIDCGVYFSSCSEAKRAQRIANRAKANETAFASVGKAYILKNGCLTDVEKSDTATGQVITGSNTSTVKHDTIREQVPCDTFSQVTLQHDTVTVDRYHKLTVKGTTIFRVDTVPKYITKTIVDRTQLNIAVDSLNFYESAYHLAVERQKTAEAMATKFKVMFYSFLILLLILIGLNIYWKFTKKLTIL